MDIDLNIWFSSLPGELHKPVTIKQAQTTAPSTGALRGSPITEFTPEQLTFKQTHPAYKGVFPGGNRQGLTQPTYKDYTPQAKQQLLATNAARIQNPRITQPQTSTAPGQIPTTGIEWLDKGTGRVNEWWKKLPQTTRGGIKRFGYAGGAGLLATLIYNMFSSKPNPLVSLGLPLLAGGVNAGFPQIQDYLKSTYNKYMEQQKTAPKTTMAGRGLPQNQVVK